MTTEARRIHVGVLALQGAFSEHIDLLKQAFVDLDRPRPGAVIWSCEEIRTPEALALCDALIMPGGESTTMALVAERSGLLEPLRNFVKSQRKPTWGTCAGLILLAEAANRTKKGGQDLIGGLDVRVRRNHFGRQVESFERQLSLPFLSEIDHDTYRNYPITFKGVFIRAPIVEKILAQREGIQAEEQEQPDSIVAPSKAPRNTALACAVSAARVEVMATLSRAAAKGSEQTVPSSTNDENIIAIRQGNCFGLSFHPELTNDARIHIWWLQQIEADVIAEQSSRDYLLESKVSVH